MERCLDCNSVLAASERMCPTCGRDVRHGAKRKIGELLAWLGQVILYSALLALIVSRLFTNLDFVAVWAACAALAMLLTRRKL